MFLPKFIMQIENKTDTSKLRQAKFAGYMARNSRDGSLAHREIKNNYFS